MSKHYERMPKPAAIAIQELEEGKIVWRRQEDAAAQLPPAETK